MAIFLYEQNYDVSEIRERWIRSRTEEAIVKQLYHMGFWRPIFKDHWPKEKRDRLTMLWMTGVTSGQIAKIMNLTRNMVIGKLKSMELIPGEYLNDSNPHLQSAKEAYPQEDFSRRVSGSSPSPPKAYGQSASGSAGVQKF